MNNSEKGSQETPKKEKSKESSNRFTAHIVRLIGAISLLIACTIPSGCGKKDMSSFNSFIKGKNQKKNYIPIAPSTEKPDFKVEMPPGGLQFTFEKGYENAEIFLTGTGFEEGMTLKINGRELTDIRIS